MNSGRQLPHPRHRHRRCRLATRIDRILFRVWNFGSTARSSPLMQCAARNHGRVMHRAGSGPGLCVCCGPVVRLVCASLGRRTGLCHRCRRLDCFLQHCDVLSRLGTLCCAAMEAQPLTLFDTTPYLGVCCSLNAAMPPPCRLWSLTRLRGANLRLRWLPAP